MQKRLDISDTLIHFIRAETKEAAFSKLLEIIDSGILKGSSNMIKGSYNCVCFTETPVAIIKKDGFNRMQFQDFGIIFNKKDLFTKGARPVIYQTDEEYEFLADQIKWKHVKYDLSTQNKVDWTHEREWRIKTDSINILNFNFSLLFPDTNWENEYINSCENQVEMYSLIMDELLAHQYIEAFPTTVVADSIKTHD
ncbi:hypothetical protein [Francisella philomiragia]|nr:hypothetical protein [Francisella philomiragia]